MQPSSIIHAGIRLTSDSEWEEESSLIPNRECLAQDLLSHARITPQSGKPEHILLGISNDAQSSVCWQLVLTQLEESWRSTIAFQWLSSR